MSGRLRTSKTGGSNLSRRDEWRKVLDAEVERWSAMHYDELVTALSDRQAYEVEFDAKKYQVGVEILEVTASVLPLSRSFFCLTKLNHFQQAFLFPRNAEIPSCASSAMAFWDMASFVYAYAPA